MGKLAKKPDGWTRGARPAWADASTSMRCVLNEMRRFEMAASYNILSTRSGVLTVADRYYSITTQVPSY
jgi:hypothetical protein